MNKKGFEINFNLENIRKTIVQHKKLFGLALIGLLIFFIGSATGIIPLNTQGILNPGFEGGKATIYGATIFNQGYIGSNVFSLYQNASSNKYIVYKGMPFFTPASSSTDYYYWANDHLPYDTLIGHRYPVYANIPTVPIGYGEYPQLGAYIGDIQLQGVDIHGDPTNYGTNEAQRINFYPKTLVPSTTSGNVTTYSYSVTETSLLLVPAEFYISFYLVPSQQDYGTALSGWREGGYSNVQIWCRLDWTTWNNAYYDSWLNDSNANMFISTYGGAIANQQQLSNFRGGFPIASWIQKWQKAGYNSLPDTQQQGGSYTPNAESATWYTMMGAQGPKTYTAEQLSQLQQNLLACIQINPSLIGEPLSLFTDVTPNWNYYNDPLAFENSDPNDTNSLISLANAPSTGMAQTMYFPVDIANLATYAEGYGGILGGWKSWNIYYPTASFDVRIIYGLYGNFTYLWTESVTNPTNATTPGLGYPKQIELPQTTVVHTQGLSLPSFEIFSPLNLELFAILFVAVIIIVTILNPGVWSAIFGNRKQRGVQSQKSSVGKKT